MSFIKDFELCGCKYAVRVYDPVFDGTPKNVMVRDGGASMHPFEARELAKALIDAAKYAEDAQEKYDSRLREASRMREAQNILERTGALETPQINLEPIVDLIAERNFLRGEVSRLKCDLGYGNIKCEIKE